MRKLFYLLPAMLLLAACQNKEQLRMREVISALEINVKSNPVDSTLKPLLQQYNAYLSQYPKDGEWFSVYCYRAAQLYYRVGNNKEAMRLLKKAEDSHPKAGNAPNVLMLMASILDEKLNNSEEAAKYAKEFIKRYPKHRMIEEAKSFSMPKQQRWEAKIQRESDQFMKFSKETNDQLLLGAIGGKLIGLYRDYVLAFPDNPNAPEYLYAAGKTAKISGNVVAAIQLWEETANQYPESPKAPEALYIVAFEKENTLMEFDEAKATYQKLIEKYPNHELAQNAKIALPHVGKSPDEVVKGFQAR